MQEENDDLEWEEWNPSEISFGKHMIAGSIAGLVEHVTIYPIDTIKTHIQYERSATFQPLHTWENAKAFMQKDGFFRLWRGVSAMFAGCIPGQCALSSPLPNFIYNFLTLPISVFHSTLRVLHRFRGV